MRVVWTGPLASWASAFGSVDQTEDPRGVDADLVVLAGEIGGLTDWLRRPRARPAALVVCSRDGEEAALQAGAEAVLAPNASPDDGARAARHARARHASVRADAELYRLMVENATDLITVSNSRGETIYASPSAFDLVGRTAEEVVTGPSLQSVHPEDVERVREVLADGFATGGIQRLQYRLVGADGRARVLESRGRAAQGPDGEALGIVSTRDVTDRVVTEERLRASRARFQTIVHALPDVVSRLDPDGLVLDFHVPDVFATEFPAEQMIGKRLQDIIPVPLAAKFLAAHDQLRQSGAVVAYGYEVEIGGRTYYREVRMAPIEGGEILSILRDVTPLREHEVALERSQAELRALAAHLQEVREEERTRLSREVHDVLGQQLTAIRLGIGWFGRHFPDDDGIQARLTDIRQTIDETIRHVRQIAADLRPGVLDDFGLASAVEWQGERFEARSGTPCRVDVQGRAEPPPEVATAAFRVLQEALTNVSRHAHADAVAVTLVLGPEAVRLVVADDGRGFDPERAGRRSLGLVGMRERARAQGGTLEVRAVPGQGTVVECTLPHASDPHAPSPPNP